MTQRFCFSRLPIVLSCLLGNIFNDATRDKTKFETKLREAGSKAGWKTPRGGRSWSKEDELNYDAWIMDTQKVTANIFVEWDIPTDCADAAMGLRFIYALSNGLALKFGKYDSYIYADKPLELLKKAVNTYSTANIGSIIYSVDMWDKSQYNAGNFWLIRDEHTIPVRFDEGFFYTFNSTVPAAVRLMEEGLFTEDSYGGRGAKFYRFYANSNIKGKIDIDEKVSFEAHPNEKKNKPNFYQCTQDVKEEPFWRNLLKARYSILNVKFNQQKLEADKIACPHNVMFDAKYILPGSQIPQEKDIVDLSKIDKIYHEKICNNIQKRIEIVEEGYQKCHNISTPECAAGESGSYSTPGRDTRLLGDITKYVSIMEEANNDDILPCVINIRGDLNQQKKNISLSLEVLAFSIYNEDGERLKSDQISDPKASIPERWGCNKDDVDLKCLHEESEE